MIIYVWILIVIDILASGIAIGSDDSSSFVKRISRLLIFLPIYGRILGWW